MKFTELTVLLPCHSLEDFPVYHEGRSADELLAAWCAAWHPALVASAEVMPNWHRADTPPEMLAGRLLLLPEFCLDRVPAGFVARTKTEGAWLVQQPTLAMAVSSALEGLDGGNAGVEDSLATDFLALGFCRLQVELLTRQMRYSMHIDETHFQNELVAAAKAAVAHDAATAHEHLRQCFETLYESRKHFYPVDIYLIDLTLAAATTLGESLRAELDETTPTNLLLPTTLLQQLSASEPATRQSLLNALDGATACVLGGELTELELPLLPPETALASLTHGVSGYEEVLGRRPTVYARRRAGLWPALPQLLVKLAYQGALHFTLDDGRFAVGPQCKIRWEGLDSNVIDALVRVPLDAARPETFLGLSRKMADSLDSDHVATLLFAHWPRAASPWHDLLRRTAQLSPVLGKFMLLDDYFSHTDMPGRISKFEPDEYRTPYLKQAVDRCDTDPISKFVDAHHTQARRAAVRAIDTLRDVIAGQTTPDHENALDRSSAGEAELTAAAARLSGVLPRAKSDASSGYLLVNPLSFTRRMGLELDEAGDRKFAVAEVPAMGFAWIDAKAIGRVAARAKPIAQENVLRNEFFEVTIGRNSGGIQSVYNFRQRGNQLSQQLALRTPPAAGEPGTWRDPDAAATYSTMRAESVAITAASPTMGEITSRGLLLGDDGRRVGGFRQTVQVWADSRIIRVAVELDGLEELPADPWNAYYGARFAWPDQTADLWRGIGLARQRTDTPRLEAPEFIEIDSGGARMSILTGGLPYHRRSDPRMLDSLLVVRGEQARSFRFAIGVDVPQPAAAALEFMTPTVAYHETAIPPAATSGWLFHVDAKNVVATDWQPLVAAESNATIGFRARLLETAGRSGRVTLRTFRPVATARQIDFLGQTMLDAHVEGDKIALDFAANEWIEVEAAWHR
jgi:alpha-mannosidase